MFHLLQYPNIHFLLKEIQFHHLIFPLRYMKVDHHRLYDTSLLRLLPLFVAKLDNYLNEYHLFYIYLLKLIFHLLTFPMLQFFYNLKLYYLHIERFVHQFHNIFESYLYYPYILIIYLYIFY